MGSSYCAPCFTNERGVSHQDPTPKVAQDTIVRAPLSPQSQTRQGQTVAIEGPVRRTTMMGQRRCSAP